MNVLVLDGGLATQLEATGHDLSDGLWSARLLVDDPGAIVAAHRAFVEAGAQVITTASYQASIEGFARRGLDARPLLRRSVELAREAAGSQALVAASVGPYGAMLADGSEYRGDYGLTVKELAAWHRPRLEILAEAGPDLLALETIPDVREAQALLAAIEGVGVRAWLSYSIRGDLTNAGQSLVEAAELVAGNDAIIAVGVNCSAPADAATAVAPMAWASGKPVVIYPNSGETWDAAARRWRSAPRPVGAGGVGAGGLGRGEAGRGEAGRGGVSAGVAGWVADGARLVGGCCRVTPTDIAEIAAALAESAGSGGREPLV